VYTTGFDIQTGDWACLGANCPMRFKLSKGVLHIAGYPEPGEKGNSIIVGHSSAYASEPGDYKTVFAKINELGIGDTFEIRYSNNKVQKFKVFESFEYKLSNALSNNPSQEATDASNKRNNRYPNDNVVTLETCWPVGTNKDRWVVQAKLI
jgi:LPXTG-site transpeptidase (sortase) family protein